MQRRTSPITPRIRRRSLLALLAAGATMPSRSIAEADEPIIGTGATFPAKVYRQWAEDHSRLTGRPLQDRPAGSSAGVKAVSEGKVDFGASDVPLSPEELKRRGLFQFPTLVGGIVPFVNLPGIVSGELRLDPPTLARIWGGGITRWNDSAIRALNPDLELPSTPIVRVVRSDGSGTTTVFVQYLRQAAPEQATGIEPDGGRARWPGRTVGADGSGALVAAVLATPGAIGYASSDYTLRDRLTAVSLKNPRGEFVVADLPAFRAAIVAGGLFKTGLTPTPLLGTQGAGAWPIVTATYVLVPSRPASLDRAARTLHFFYRSFLLGDKAVAGTGFAPLPVATQARIVALLSGFRTRDGIPVQVIGLSVPASMR
jgi:phosphate transport system substrate-binding protein